MNEFAKQVLEIAKSIQSEMPFQRKTERRIVLPETYMDEIYWALKNVSDRLAQSYLQVKMDVDAQTRISWAGTAHEIREILATLLRELAPDEVVSKQAWYQKEGDSSSPTQKQRVKYILQQRRAGTNEKKIMSQIDLVENRVATLVRATYARASNAAHTFEGHKEVLRILKYFEAFVRDLLDV